MKRILVLCVAFVLAAGCAVEGAEGTGSKTAKPEVKTAKPELKTAKPELKTAKPELKTAKPELKTAKPELKTLGEKFGYIVGVEAGMSVKRLNVDVDMKALMRGVEDGLAGRKPLITQEAARAVITQINELAAAKAKAKAAKAAEAGDAFLAANKKKEGVVTTASGLQYLILKKGDGPKPTADDMVSVHYRGTLIDGTEFDSSYKRGEPAKFRVGGVIRGWTEALQLMNVGTKCRLFIPSKLAYGANGRGAMIGPNEALIFEVELLAIEPPTELK